MTDKFVDMEALNLRSTPNSSSLLISKILQQTEAKCLGEAR